MVFRPAFLDRFLSRLPDPLSLRFRVVGGAGLVAGLFGVLLVLAAVQLDARRCAEVAREHAETLAHSAGAWLDGDAHAGLGPEPEKRLTDLTASLEKLLTSSDYPGQVRTLRAKPEAKATLAAHPGAPRAGALEVVLQTGKSVVRTDVDYRPEMAAALFEGQSASAIAGGQVAAYAPVPDSWGATPAIVWVTGPAAAPLWRRVAFPLGAILFAGLLVSFVVWLARRASEQLELQLATLDSSLRQLGSGRIPAAIALPRRAPRELSALAEALETLRARLEAQAGGQALPPLPEDAEEEAQRTLLGEASEFDLALLMQQIVEPARKIGHTRGVDVQLVFPDGVPSQLVGYPLVLFRALDALLRNALRATAQGRVALRVNRAGEGPDGGRLRFEVADTSPGIAFGEQAALGASLAAAANADPAALKDPLQFASALAHALGGELAFESQPGQGSRFGFTAAFQGLGPAPATGFHPRAATAFEPRPPLPARPGPALGPPQSAFLPRKTIGMR